MDFFGTKNRPVGPNRTPPRKKPCRTPANAPQKHTVTANMACCIFCSSCGATNAVAPQDSFPSDGRFGPQKMDFSQEKKWPVGPNRTLLRKKPRRTPANAAQKHTVTANMARCIFWSSCRATKVISESKLFT